MKLFSLVLTLLAMILTGCATHPHSTQNRNLTRETWQHKLPTHTQSWTRGADSWFLTGGDNNTTAPAADNAAMSTMMVKVPDFTRIKIEGDFEVQLFGTEEANSVYLYGPNRELRQIDVEVRGNAICITQMKNASAQIGKVIVRIGIRQLNDLHYFGNGRVEGVKLQSNGLAIVTGGCGNVFLAGNMKLRYAKQLGSGRINVFGVNTPCLDIFSFGSGTLNMQGNMGVRTISHKNSDNIHLVGANTSQALRIDASGNGEIAIVGTVNLADVKAREQVRIYIDSVQSNLLRVNLYDSAILGLQGQVNHLNFDAVNDSCFLARYLCVRDAYVRATDSAHLNLSVSHKLFISSTNRSSVYLFGKPDVVSQFASGNGTIIPILNADPHMCRTTWQPACLSYKGECAREQVYAYTPRMPVTTARVQALPHSEPIIEKDVGVKTNRKTNFHEGEA